MAFIVLNPIVAGKYELKNKILLSKHDFLNYHYCFFFFNSRDVEGIES